MNQYRLCEKCGNVYVISVNPRGGKTPRFCPDCYLFYKNGIQGGSRLPSRILMKVKN